MKKLLILAALLVACSPSPTPTPTPSPTGSVALSPSGAPSPSQSPVVTACQDMTHVYHAYRLTILSPCQSVNGIVEIIRVEADGDYHILVHVDPGQTDPKGGQWINSANTTYQHGDLVTEPVCEHAITQSDAVSACVAYTNPTIVPKVGDHVRVSGPWVEDTMHSNWREIHPATYVELAALTDPAAGHDD